MRHLAFAFASVASLVTAAAHADTFDVADPNEVAVVPSAPVPAPVAEPLVERNMYLGLGGLAGTANGNLLVAAWTADAGYRLDDSAIWIHAMISTGGTAQFLASGTGAFSQTRLGVERRGCFASGLVCSMLGADLGYQHATYSGTDATFDGGDGTMSSVDQASLVVIPRAGLDLGGALRVRPSVEVPIGSDGSIGLDVTLAVAFEW